MTTQVQFSTFNFHNSPVRTITDPKGEIWFCGTDVCNILGYVNPRDAISKHCKVGGVAKRDTPTTRGKMPCITQAFCLLQKWRNVGVRGVTKIRNG